MEKAQFNSRAVISSLEVRAIKHVATINDVFVEAKKHYITIFVLCEMDVMNAEPQKTLEPQKYEGWIWRTWDDLMKINSNAPGEKLLLRIGIMPGTVLDPIASNTREHHRAHFPPTTFVYSRLALSPLPCSLNRRISHRTAVSLPGLQSALDFRPQIRRYRSPIVIELEPPHQATSSSHPSFSYTLYITWPLRRRRIVALTPSRALILPSSHRLTSAAISAQNLAAYLSRRSPSYQPVLDNPIISKMLLFAIHRGMTKLRL
ncbi:ADP-ribose pyrophosphatase [Fusarium mundagurra]|uniref:ADP-ribose pyrophosphatase n=1 Tax=Fusarium mundagurra TaxID=1567541 RepID=A0A8H6D321_9HYPO|nr:ADP-ribose pyrophosphatase [Fusarium mundagurra]